MVSCGSMVLTSEENDTFECKHWYIMFFFEVQMDTTIETCKIYIPLKIHEWNTYQYSRGQQEGSTRGRNRKIHIWGDGDLYIVLPLLLLLGNNYKYSIGSSLAILCLVCIIIMKSRH